MNKLSDLLNKVKAVEIKLIMNEESEEGILMEEEEEH